MWRSPATQIRWAQGAEAGATSPAVAAAISMEGVVAAMMAQAVALTTDHQWAGAGAMDPRVATGEDGGGVEMAWAGMGPEVVAEAATVWDVE